MSNTVSLLSYSNTFGDWMVTTNALVKENNDLAANNYIKPTGTLYLNSPTLGLQVANNAVVAGQLQVSGIGSSVSVDNNLTVKYGQVYFQNTILGLVNSGQANINGLLIAQGPGTSIAVTNGAFFKSNTLTIGVANIANSLFVQSNTTTNNITVQSNTTTQTLTVNTAAYIGTYLTVVNDTNILNNLIVQNEGFMNNLQSNVSVNTATLSVTGKSFTDTLQANTNAVVNALTVTNDTYTNTLQANSGINSGTTITAPTINATNYAYVNNLSANNNLSVTNNFSMLGTSFQATNAAGAFKSLSVDGTFTVNGTTVYNSATLTLSALTPNQLTRIGTYRTLDTGNAYIRWTETNRYWDVNDVVTGNYWRILTDQYRSDSTTIGDTSNIATSNAVFYLQGALNSSNTALSSNVATLNSSISSNVATLNSSISSNVSTLTTTFSNASNIINGTLNAARLPTSGVTAGTYGTASSVPIVTVDSTGRITTVTTTAVAGVSSFNYITSNATFQIGTSAGTYFTAPLSSIPNSALANYTISGVALGSTLSTLSMGVSGTGLSGSASYNGSDAATFTVTSNATNVNTGGTIVARDGSGNFSAGTITATLSGNSSTTSQTNFSNLTINSSQVLYAGNYNSYAPTLTGTGAYGTWGINITGNAATTSQTNFSNLTIGSSQVLYAGNYNSYAPTLTGTGASGTWGINITGNAATATSATSATTASYLNTTQQTNTIIGSSTNLNAYYSGADGSFVCKSSGTGEGGMAGICFWNDAYAIKLGIRNDGYFILGGWSRSVDSWYSDPSGNMVAAGNVTAYSDPLLKEDFKQIENALDIVTKLNGGTFNWKKDIPHIECKAGKRDYGILANEVEKVMPEIVSESIDVEGIRYKMVAYEKMIPVLIEAIKELKTELDELKSSK